MRSTLLLIFSFWSIFSFEEIKVTQKHDFSNSSKKISYIKNSAKILSEVTPKLMGFHSHSNKITLGKTNHIRYNNPTA